MSPSGAADAVGVIGAGRAGQGVSTPTWMAMVKAESDAHRRAGATAVSVQRRRQLTADRFEEPQSKDGSRRGNAPRRASVMSSRFQGAGLE
ncbi:hypothetical protein AB0L53_39575 [Nonomuraea sp. NPDC052129]|uniref:hypothetical protein n=1 Tax=Nonomuraea sp. NPDC052129 TaxID=3154651 RepID=UPI0034407598